MNRNKRITVKIVRDYELERQAIHQSVDPDSIPLGLEESVMGVTHYDNPIPIGPHTIKHILVNGHAILSRRSDNAVSGSFGESLSAFTAATSLALITRAQGNASSCYDALTASSFVLGVVGLQIFNTRANIQLLEKLAREYDHSNWDTASQAEKVINQLYHSGIPIDNAHRTDPDKLDEAINAIVKAGSPHVQLVQRVPVVKYVRSTDYYGDPVDIPQTTHAIRTNKDKLKKIGSGAKEIVIGSARDLKNTPKNLPQILKSSTIGLKDCAKSVFYIPHLVQELGAKEASLYGLLVLTFLGEGAFIGSSLYTSTQTALEISQAFQESSDFQTTLQNQMLNMSVTTLSFFGAFASLLPLQYFAKEVSHVLDKSIKNAHPIISRQYWQEAASCLDSKCDDIHATLTCTQGKTSRLAKTKRHIKDLGRTFPNLTYNSPQAIYIEHGARSLWNRARGRAIEQDLTDGANPSQTASLPYN